MKKNTGHVLSYQIESD